MLVVGLSGSAGSGKSTVAGIISRFCHAAVFDADKEVSLMYESNSRVIALAGRYFPDAICNGRIMKRELLKHFFAYDQVWCEFQSVVHKIIWRKRHKFITKCIGERRDYAVLDIPLLLETGFLHLCDVVIRVHVNRSAQIARLCNRGFSQKEAEFLLSLQVPEGKRRNLADFHINSGQSMAMMSQNVLNIICSLSRRV